MTPGPELSGTSQVTSIKLPEGSENIKSMNPTASLKSQHFYARLKIHFSPGLTGMCPPLPLTPCVVIEYGRVALFLNIITICSPTSALIIGPTGENKTHVIFILLLVKTT